MPKPKLIPVSYKDTKNSIRLECYADTLVYGRGEKYSLEVGNDLQRVISSEYALLASPDTLPLFLRKYQRKTLKQYQRRERVCKGQGDIIVCLDESGVPR